MRQRNCTQQLPFPPECALHLPRLALFAKLCLVRQVYIFFVRYSNVLEALEDYFLFYSDDSPEKPAPPQPLLVQPSPKLAPLSPAAMPLEHHDAGVGAFSADGLVVSAGANADDSSSGVKARRPSFLSLQDLSDAAVSESQTSPNEKEKKGRWQGLLSSAKVPSFPSNFSRRPSLQDDSFLRVQRQTEKAMMRRLRASVTYKLALLESHMHRYEDAKVAVL